MILRGGAQGGCHDRQTVPYDNFVVAVLYGLGFVLIPASMMALYGGPMEPHVILNIQFFGSALLALGVIGWFAKDFREWDPVRGVLAVSEQIKWVRGIAEIS